MCVYNKVCFANKTGLPSVLKESKGGSGWCARWRKEPSESARLFSAEKRRWSGCTTVCRPLAGVFVAVQCKARWWSDFLSFCESQKRETHAGGSWRASERNAVTRNAPANPSCPQLSSLSLSLCHPALSVNSEIDERALAFSTGRQEQATNQGERARFT